MPTALCFNVPAYGHVGPSLPLVAELTRRGHRITYYSTEKFRARVEAAGATFQSCAAHVQDDYFDARGLSNAVPQRLAHQLMITAGEILPELLEAIRRAHPDYLLFDGMCPWGQMLAWITGLPGVASLALLPLSFPPPDALRDLDILRVFLSPLLRDYGEGVESVRLAQSLAMEYNYNLPSVGPTGVLNATGDLAISYTSAYFQPYASTVSERVRFVGWSVIEPSDADLLWLDQARAKANGRPLIYISLGTLNNDDRAFFEACIAAFTGTDFYILMTTGNRIRPEHFGPLPENIAIHSWIPQIAVLEEAVLFVTHGGMNSIHDGLYFGVPLLLVPQQEEQTLNAMRVVELGAGLRLKKWQIMPEAIRADALRLLTDSRYKAESTHIGETLRSAGGVARAVDEIQALLRITGKSTRWT